MVRSRLEELRKYCPTLINNDTIIEIRPSKTELEIFDILTEYAKMREWMDTIRANIETMKGHIREMSQQTFIATKQAVLPESMQQLRAGNMSLCQKIYSYMKEMEMDLPDGTDMATVARVKRLHFYSVREEFLLIWRYNEQFLMDYEERLMRQVQKQARIADTNITEEETEALIANNATSIFVGNFLENVTHERNKLRELLDRKSELEKVERSLMEVRDMFMRINALVIDQSPLIAQVEYFAHQATLNVDKGASKLEKARQKKIKRLRRKILFLFWLTVVLTIIILVLLFVD